MLDATKSPSSRPFFGIPAGITPQVINSLGNLLNRRSKNIAIRKKNLLGHTIIAQATKATRTMMTTQMQEIANAPRDLERSKIEVQLKSFTEQMAYQREKDRCMYQNAANLANDNARLGILKQGEMVNCLSQLSTILSKGLTI